MILPAEAPPLLDCLRPGLHPPDLPPLRHPARLGHPHHRPAHRRQPAPHPRARSPQGHRTSYQRVLSQARWSGLQLACALCRLRPPAPAPPTGPITLVGDDTVDGHPGKQGLRQGPPPRPGPLQPRATPPGATATSGSSSPCWSASPSPPAPGPCRCWWTCTAPRRTTATGGRPHRTPAQLMCRAAARCCLRWFPGRRFVFVGDAGYGTHEVARFCHRHRGRLTLVSKLHPEANLFEPPPPYPGKGRPRVKGAGGPSRARRSPPRAGCRQRLTVAWYGGGTRRVEIVTGTGHWYKAGRGLVPDRAGCSSATGTGRTATSTSSRTDPALDAGRPSSALRRPLEHRDHLPRAAPPTSDWRRRGAGAARTVLRAAPCLFGLYSVVALLYRAAAARRSGRAVWTGRARTG